MKLLLFSVLCFLFFTGCKKSRPSEGEYTIKYTYLYNSKPEFISNLRILESNPNWLIISAMFADGNYYGQDTLFKSNNQIQGRHDARQLIGTITRAGLSTRFKITGSFLYTSSWPSSSVKNYQGTFEIKRK